MIFYYSKEIEYRVRSSEFRRGGEKRNQLFLIEKDDIIK